MESQTPRGTISLSLNDTKTSDITIRCLKNKGRPQLFHSHSSILKEKSKFFAHKLSCQNPTSIIDIHCSNSNYGHLVDLLKRFYLPKESLLESWVSVDSTLGVLQAAFDFDCQEITQSCIQYLEAVPWEEKEEESILKVVSKLGPEATPILARIQPVDFSATKKVFISAVRFATSVGQQCTPFGDELKNSAQEQVEYMLGDDDDKFPLVKAGEEVKSAIKNGLLTVCSSFDSELSNLLSQTDVEASEKRIMQSLLDLEWICSILSKVNSMKDFVDQWVDLSNRVIQVAESKKLENTMWGMKVKLIELTAKVLDAVGYGNVIISQAQRVVLVKLWLPYIRKSKPVLDTIGNEETGFPYKMNEDLCQSIEGAIVGLVSAFSSNDQAEILADWTSRNQAEYPDLSEAFEVWCCRTKSAKRRLLEPMSACDHIQVNIL